MKKKHIGSSFDDFLQEEGLLAVSEATAVKRVIAASKRGSGAHVRMDTAASCSFVNAGSRGRRMSTTAVLQGRER